MSDARKLLAHITVAGTSTENPLLTIPGYYAFQQFLEQLLERIERLEEQADARSNQP